jgi:dihydropteroate synthase
MGILNVTPDSFSDGGQFNTSASALARAKAMEDEGAAIIDIGAESTRPGFQPVPLDEELARLAPLLPRLFEVTSLPVSIDTTKPEVARFACAQGASIINDIWGLQKFPKMAHVAAEMEAVVVIMHNRETVDGSIDILQDMRRFFDRSLELALRAGIPKNHIILDPGIGFGKTVQQNLIALKKISALQDYGQPLLIGASRKSFLKPFVGDAVPKRALGTLAVNLDAWRRGASLFRVHDVALHSEAFKLWQAIETAE